MPSRYATLIPTGQRLDPEVYRLPALYRTARELLPEGFTAEETRTLDALSDHVSLGMVDRMRKDIAARLELPPEIFSLDRFAFYSCGPISRHDDKFRYPDVYFVIVVVHGGALGVVDMKMRAVRHPPGDILLLDPHRKHALVPEGLRARDYPYERTHSPVRDEERQFLFLSFDIKRRDLRQRFRLMPGWGSSG